MRFRFQLVPLVLTCLLALGLSSLAEERLLVILHTNDIHGHVEAHEQGGLTRLAARIRTLREEFQGKIVLLDAGDTSLGTPLSGHYYGKPTADIMSYLKYDAVAIGNHEFNWGQERMRTLTDWMNTHVLSANLVNIDGTAPPYPSHTILERNGIRLAVIGLVTPDTHRRAHVESTRGWEFLGTETAVRNTLPAIEEQVDARVILSHIGVPADKKLAEAVPEIDLIVGGHSHTPLHQVVYAGKTPIVQAGCYARYLGVLKIMVDPEKDKLRVVDYNLEAFDESSPVDPGAAQITEKYAADLRPILQRTVAHVSDTIKNSPSANSFDTPLGDFISDVFRRQADSDLALYNRAGVRFDMEAGPLKVEGVHKLFPFDDPVMVLEASGEQLQAVLEQGTIDGEGPLSASGLKAVVGADGVKSVQISGEPLDPKRVYTIATTKFLSNGGDGMSTLAQLKKIRTLPFTREVLLKDLETHKELAPPRPGRLQKLTLESTAR